MAIIKLMIKIRMERVVFFCIRPEYIMLFQMDCVELCSSNAECSDVLACSFEV